MDHLSAAVQKRKELTFKDGELISAKCWDWNGNEEDCDELNSADRVGE
jgi:hypothetical protein